MKIVTLNPPYFPMFSRASRSPAVTKSSTLYYPFFLAYATGVLEDDGFDVTLIDAPGAKLDRQTTLDKIKDINPGIVFCETSTPSIENDLEVMKEIKEAGVPMVVATGTHVSAMPEEVLSQNPFVDAVCRHEYEYTVRGLANRIRSAPQLNTLEGNPVQRGRDYADPPATCPQCFATRGGLGHDRAGYAEMIDETSPAII